MSVARTLKTYVIDLPQFERSHETAAIQLDVLGSDYESFRAIERRDGDDFFEGIDEHRYVLNTGRAPSDGEIGRYASHFYLWNLCAALDEPIVVLEDGVALEVRFAAALDAVKGAIRHFGFVGLHGEGSERRSRLERVARFDGFTVSYCRRYPEGAMCYAVMPGAARAFVRSSRIVTGSVDSFIGRYWSHGQPLYMLSPPVVRGGRLIDHSAISRRGDESLRAPTCPLRAVASVRSTVARLAFDLRHGPSRRRARPLEQ